MKVNQESEVDVEKDLEQLEEIVRELEDEQLNLDRSIELFEKGVELAEEIKGSLSEAELKLKKVIESSDLDFEAEDFNL